ncbi:hypothetical protein [Methylovorus mays]|uniref:hypothetical protein n=1 Tax=Methylovorus mays TaxID=184077 RepID=UPI001E61C7BA|nr:hypothetical protein [Methylovorus mays]MCB5206095.1 hypothetical protein [Methylovorus mays]
MALEAAAKLIEDNDAYFDHDGLASEQQARAKELADKVRALIKPSTYHTSQPAQPDQWNAAIEAAAELLENISDDYQEREYSKWPEMRTDAQSGISECVGKILALRKGA